MANIPNGGKGRPPGYANKRTVEFMQTLEAAGFNPAQALIDLHKIAMTRMAEEMEKEDSGKISPMESKVPQFMKIATDAAKELASYAYPKLKAIEQTKTNPTQGMTVTEKLQAAKAMVQILEQEVKSDQPGPT